MFDKRLTIKFHIRALDEVRLISYQLGNWLVVKKEVQFRLDLFSLNLFTKVVS
jgi:hypothetical protein